MVFLSILTPVYVSKLSYGSGISIIATYTFKGYTMDASYVFSCGSHTNVTSVPNMFDKDIISWYDMDKSVKNTPKNPALMEIPLPLVIGNHSDNPHVDGTDIIVKLESGKTYVIRGPVCAEKSKVDEAEQQLVDILNDGPQCYYLDGDIDGYNNK